MAPHAAHRRPSCEQAPPTAGATTPQKPLLESALPQQWRQPAGMVLAAAALLLCAPYLWGRSPGTPLIAPVAVSRRHLQQPNVHLPPPPSIQLQPTGSGPPASRMTSRERSFADLHDREHANDPPPERQEVPPYQPPDGNFQPPVARAARGNEAAPPARRRMRHYPEGYVALCLAVKDQAADLAEWLEWHQLLGVSRMYVFDMGTAPPMNQTLQPYIESGLVEYHWVDKGALPAKGEPGKQPPQLAIYDICIQEFRHRHAWMGFIDADEFLVPRNRSLQLPALLKAYEAHGGLAVNWDVFGSSGHTTRPPGGTLKSYWRCVKHDNQAAMHTKMLVNLCYADRPYKDPHTFTYTHGTRAVNERFAFVDAPVHGYHTSEQIVLHHYVSKSLQENQEKMARGSGMLNKKHKVFFDEINELATEECLDGIHAAEELDFWPEQPAADVWTAKQRAAERSPAAAAGGDQQQLSPAQPAAAEKLLSVPDAVNATPPSTNDTAYDEEPPPADSIGSGLAAQAVASIDAIIGALSSVAAGTGRSTDAMTEAQQKAPGDAEASGASDAASR